MSSLYSHPDFPNKGPKEVNQELMSRINSNPLRLLLPKHISNYIQALWTKKATGQPVTFTDIFGMLIGETLIPSVRDVRRRVCHLVPPLLDSHCSFSNFTITSFSIFLPFCSNYALSNQRMDIKLSSIQEKINQAQSPLPLFTCLHVKPDVSELMFAGNRLLRKNKTCASHLILPPENCFS